MPVKESLKDTGHRNLIIVGAVLRGGRFGSIVRIQLDDLLQIDQRPGVETIEAEIERTVTRGFGVKLLGNLLGVQRGIDVGDWANQAALCRSEQVSGHGYRWIVGVDVHVPEVARITSHQRGSHEGTHE